MEFTMVAEGDARPGPAELAEAIRSQIAQRTRRRIRMLAVDVMDGRVVVRGCAANFHLKQLAIQGAFDVLGSLGMAQFDLEMQVTVDPPRTDPEGI